MHLRWFVLHSWTNWYHWSNYLYLILWWLSATLLFVSFVLNYLSLCRSKAFWYSARELFAHAWTSFIATKLFIKLRLQKTWQKNVKNRPKPDFSWCRRLSASSLARTSASCKTNVMVFSICPRISSAAAYRRWWTNNLNWNIVASVPQVGDKKQKQQRLPKKRERKLVFFCLFKKRQTPTYSEHQPNSLWTVKKPLCYLRFGPFKIGAYTECASRSHIFGSYNSKIQITSRLKQSRKKSNIKAELNSCSKYSRFHIDEAFQYAEHWGFIYRNN